jgi:GTP cyclohydrolase I
MNNLPEKWFIKGGDELTGYIAKNAPGAGYVGDVEIYGYFISSFDFKWDCDLIMHLVNEGYEEITLQQYLASQTVKDTQLTTPLSHVTHLLEYIGEDTTREGLVDTPKRVIKMYAEIFKGYTQKPEDILTTFAADGYDAIVLLKDIELYSMCEHHMLPFYGKAHVAYIPDPNGRIVGISKLARLVDIFAKRLQIQERLGDQVTSALMETLNPKGAACIIEATHMCMRMRGVEKQNSVMVTSSMKGVFLTDPSAKNELMYLLR